MLERLSTQPLTKHSKRLRHCFTVTKFSCIYNVYQEFEDVLWSSCVSGLCLTWSVLINFQTSWMFTFTPKLNCKGSDKGRSVRKHKSTSILFFCHQMEHVTLPPLARLAICGGTHGNEMSGVYMVREMQKQLKEDQTGSVSIATILTNPRAVEACKRYIDQDLNRCFTDALLR